MSMIEHSQGGHKASALMAEQRMRQWTLDLEVQARRQKEPAAALPKEIHPYIAISRETGAGGGAIARSIQKTLGWDVLHREILDDMAERFKLPRDMLNVVDESTSNWLIEWFGKWMDQRVVTQSEYIVHLGRLVLLAARHASTIFVGRGARFFLPPERGLAVFLVAPLEMRVAQVQAYRNCSAAEASRVIRDSDRGRRDLVKTYFNREIDDPHLYDLVINRAHTGVEEAAQLIVEQCRRRFPVEA